MATYTHGVRVISGFKSQCPDQSFRPRREPEAHQPWAEISLGLANLSTPTQIEKQLSGSCFSVMN